MQYKVNDDHLVKSAVTMVLILGTIFYLFILLGRMF